MYKYFFSSFLCSFTLLASLSVFADISQADIKNQTITQSSQDKQVKPTKITQSEIRQIQQALPQKKIIFNHTFRVKLPECNSCLFVPVQESLPKNRLTLHLVRDNKLLYTFPQSQQVKSWNFRQLKAVSFLQLDFSGPNEDGILLITEYSQSPKSNRPLPVAILYQRDTKGYKVLENTSSILTKRKVKTVAEAENIFRNELQYLP